MTENVISKFSFNSTDGRELKGEDLKGCWVHLNNLRKDLETNNLEITIYPCGPIKVKDDS